MINSLTLIYTGGNLSGATSGVIYVPIMKDETIVSLDVKADENVSGANAVFNLFLNGVEIEDLAPTINIGSDIVTISDLEIEIEKGDELVLNLVSGSVSSPVTLNLDVDDGNSGGIASAAYGVDVPPASPTAQDEEFDDADNVNALYTITAGSGVTYDVNTTIPSHLYAYFPGVSKTLHLEFPYAPVGDFSLTAKVSFQCRTASSFAGFIISAYSADEQDAIRAFWQNNTNPIVGLDYQDGGSWSFFAINETVLANLTGMVIHLQRVSDSWTAWFSLDGGRTFLRAGSSFHNKSLSVTHVEIDFQTGTQNEKVVGTIDWIRRGWRLFT
ncbi:MAG TPA: hypothetical protein VGB68_11735 [Pyrinomonadaceae bacterium]|jgi:hypothetical protein